MSSTKKEKKIAVVVCEYHQEAIQYIHRFIASKKLPFNRIKMIHFDSHPDLAFPKQLLAEDCFNKEILYNDLDIADWILPLMYEGHLQRLIWMKPPWASQLENIKTSFHIGKHKLTGELKVTCTEDYFIEDCMYTPLNRLTQSKQIHLQVSDVKELMDELLMKIERDRIMPEQKTIDECSTGKITNEQKQIDESDAGNCKRLKLDLNSEETHACAEGFLPTKDEKYILDIDLDYFSVMNPFLQDFTKEEFAELKEIYRVHLPTDKSDEELLENFIKDSSKRYDWILKTMKSFARDDNGESCSRDVDNGRFDGELKLTEFLQKFKRNHQGGKNIDWEMVHNAGLTTELPHYINNDEDIEIMISEMEELVRRLSPPTLITIARSAEDEYCPPDQVAKIEKQVIEMLQKVYETNIDVHYDYQDSSRLLL